MNLRGRGYLSILGGGLSFCNMFGDMFSCGFLVFLKTFHFFKLESHGNTGLKFPILHHPEVNSRTRHWGGGRKILNSFYFSILRGRMVQSYKKDA